MNFYKLAHRNIKKIQAAMDEARESALEAKNPLRGLKFSVLLHEDGEVETLTTVGEEFSAAVMAGTAVCIHSYAASRGNHERVSAQEAIKIASEDWV